MRRGEVYSIRNSTLGGKPCIEGEARLVRCIAKEVPGFGRDTESWLVEFLDEPGVRFGRVVKAADKVKK